MATKLSLFVLSTIFLIQFQTGHSASPAPRTIDNFKMTIHHVSSKSIIILNTKQIQIKGFRYDGAAPAVYFWAGRGNKPNKNGTKIPNEKGSYKPLQGYEGKDIVVTLPSNLTVHDIDYFAVWCKTYSVNFGHTLVPKGLNIQIGRAHV